MWPTPPVAPPVRQYARMPSGAPAVVDYSEYVEFEDEKANGARHLAWPSDAEVMRCCRWSERFIHGEAAVTRTELVELGRVMAERYAMHHWLRESARCPFCAGRLSFAWSHDHPAPHDLCFVVCAGCAWWRGEGYIASTAESEWRLCRERVAILRRFSLDSPDIPLELVRRHLARCPQDSRWLNPRRLEDLVGQVFSDFLDCETVHIGGRGDGGVDLILVEGDRTYAVQIKRRHVQKPEGVALVREFLGAMLLRGEVRGLYVTTAPRFTRAAIEAASAAQDRRLVERLELIANPRLTALCARTVDLSAPWEEAVSDMNAPPLGPHLGRLARVAQAAAAWHISGALPAGLRIVPG